LFPCAPQGQGHRDKVKGKVKGKGKGKVKVVGAAHTRQSALPLWWGEEKPP